MIYFILNFLMSLENTIITFINNKIDELSRSVQTLNNKLEEHIKTTEPAKKYKCKYCNGQGRIDNRPYSSYVTCNKCNGQGVIDFIIID